MSETTSSLSKSDADQEFAKMWGQSSLSSLLSPLSFFLLPFPLHIPAQPPSLSPLSATSPIHTSNSRFLSPVFSLLFSLSFLPLSPRKITARFFFSLLHPTAATILLSPTAPPKGCNSSHHMNISIYINGQLEGRGVFPRNRKTLFPLLYKFPASFTSPLSSSSLPYGSLSYTQQVSPRSSLLLIPKLSPLW